MKSTFYTPKQARDITAQYIQEQGNILAKNISKKEKHLSTIEYV